MSKIIPFSFNDIELRVIDDGKGVPWFVAMDVARQLDYSETEAMTRRLDDDEKQTRQIVGFSRRGITLINESGLYSAILGSSKPEAQRFKKWVTSDVLPEIRKTGGYQAQPPEPIKATADAAKLFRPMFQIARLIGCDKNAAAISANQAVNAVSGTNLLSLLGKTHLEAENQDALFFTPTELGKRIEMSARAFNLLLAEAGMQAKRGDAWEVMDPGKEFARILDTGKKHGSGVPIQQIKWSATVLPLLKQEEVA